MYKINETSGRYAILGGSFLGGGGGGSEDEGIKALEDALKKGEIYVKTVDELFPGDIVVTASAVGSPASKEGYFSADQVMEGYRIFKTMCDKEIKGIITNENGGGSTTNGWILSAMTGIPLVDAPCNGRAHPTGVMGSMGLEKDNDYISLQTAVGGKKENSIAVYANGKLDKASRIVRQAAVEAGGLVTVLRNPVDINYIEENGALGALGMAIEVGSIFDESNCCEEIIDKLKKKYGMEIVASGIVVDCSLTIEGGFDHGCVVIDDGKFEFNVKFWNEFMTIDKDGERLATFPDLIGCIDKASSKVLASSTIKKGDEVYLYKVSMENLMLGTGMKNKEQFELIEDILHTKILDYVFKE